jgi:cytochrome c oxidase cbb3-type subunit 3/ubiquinol-cytochrome c reductase cytochrome c subunit
MCAVCHGENGEGYKADQAPRLAHPNFLASVSDAFLRDAIANGRRGTTMSAWGKERGGPLDHRDVEELRKFLRTWSKDKPAVLDERPLTGDAGRGAAVYARECERCHGVRGIGGQNVGIGNPELLRNASNGFLRFAINKGRPGTQMPAFENVITPAELEDVVALVRGWGAGSTEAPPPPKMPEKIPLGPVPLNPHGPEPVGFETYPKTTHGEIIQRELARGARMALLDARASSDYLNDHIAGAVSVPFYDPAPYFDGLPKNAWLVCYCACPHAESGTLAGKLQKAGFTKVTVLDEGLGFWKSKNFSTHTGDKP